MTTSNPKRLLVPLVLAGAFLVVLPVALGCLFLVAVLFDGSDDFAPSGMGQTQMGQYGQELGYVQQGYSQQDADAAAWLQALGGASQTGSVDNYWNTGIGGASGNSNQDNSAGYVHLPSSTGGSGTTVSYGY